MGRPQGQGGSYPANRLWVVLQAHWTLNVSSCHQGSIHLKIWILSAGPGQPEEAFPSLAPSHLGVGVGRTHPTPAGWSQAPIRGLPLSDGVSSVTLTAPSLCICLLSRPHLKTGPATPSTRQSRAPAPLACPSPAAGATDGTPLLPPHTPAPSPEKAALSPGSCLTQGLQNSRTTEIYVPQPRGQSAAPHPQLL